MPNYVALGYGSVLGGDDTPSPDDPITPAHAGLRWISSQLVPIDQKIDGDTSEVTFAIRTAESSDPNAKAPQLRLLLSKQGTSEKPKYNMSLRLNTEQHQDDGDEPIVDSVSFVLAGSTYYGAHAVYLRRFAELCAALLRFDTQEDTTISCLETLWTEGINSLSNAGQVYTGSVQA
jgi:hypothetical protein